MRVPWRKPRDRARWLPIYLRVGRRRSGQSHRSRSKVRAPDANSDYIFHVRSRRASPRRSRSSARPRVAPATSSRLRASERDRTRVTTPHRAHPARARDTTRARREHFVCIRRIDRSIPSSTPRAMPSRESRATPPRVTPAIDARARRPRRRSPSRSTARRRAIAGIDAFRARSRRLDGRTYYTTDDARQKETASTTRASRATAFEDGGRASCFVSRDACLEWT